MNIDEITDQNYEKDKQRGGRKRERQKQINNTKARCTRESEQTIELQSENKSETVIKRGLVGYHN